MLTLNQEEFQFISAMVKQECGIVLEDGKQYLITSRLAGIMRENALDDFNALCKQLKSDLNRQLKEKVVDAMTTNETLWFRDQSPYIALMEKALPEMLQQLKSGRKKQIRIWSAACSTGQEPYSIAMCVQEVLGKMGYHPQPGAIEIIGTDISASALQIAKMGRYNELAMSRGMLPGFKEKYFHQQGTVWQIKPEVQAQVRFQKFNLQDRFGLLGKLDIVFLRNVAIYFSGDFKTELFRKIAETLSPAGLLFIGSAESINRYSDGYKMLEHGKCLYYQTKGERYENTVCG